MGRPSRLLTVFRASVAIVLLSMACIDPTATPGDESLTCNLESYTVPDLTGVVYHAERQLRIIQVTDITITNVADPPDDSLELRIDPGVPTFLRASDGSVVMRADTAFPVTGDSLNAWHTRMAAGDTVPRYTATRLEIFRNASGVPPTSPPCDLESYAIPDLIGVVDDVGGPVDGVWGVRVRDAVSPTVGFYGPFVFSTRIGHYPWFLVRASDSSLSVADSLVPTMGQIVQVWHNNLELRSDPPQLGVTRIEIFH